MFCPQCGTKIADDVKFCPSCGAKIVRVTESVPLHEAVQPAESPARASNASVSSAKTVTLTSGAPARSVSGVEQSSSPTAVAAASAVSRPHRVVVFVVVGVAALVVLAAIVLGVFGAPASLDSAGTGLFDAAEPQPGPQFNTGLAVSDGAYDYYYSKDCAGIVRAAIDGSDVEVLSPVAVGSSEKVHRISDFCLDGNYLYYYLVYLRNAANRMGMNLQDDLYEIHRLAIDGSGDEVIYTVSGDQYDNDDDMIDVRDVLAYEGDVYAVVETTRLNPDSESYQVLRMDSSGGNVEELTTVSNQDGCWISLRPDCMFYAMGKRLIAEEDTIYPELYMQNLDGSDVKRLYVSSIGTASSPIVLGDRFYVIETSPDGSIRQMISMDKNGDDVKVEFDIPTLEESMTEEAQTANEQSDNAPEDDITWVFDGMKGFVGSDMLATFRGTVRKQLDDGTYEERRLIRAVRLALESGEIKEELFTVDAPRPNGSDMYGIVRTGDHFVLLQSTTFDPDDCPDAYLLDAEGNITPYALDG